MFRADVVVLEQPRLLLGRDDHLRAFTVRRVTLAKAEAETGVSRSALRSWYRNGEIQSRLVDGPNGPQRLVQLGAVIERVTAHSAKAEREVSLEAQVTLLRHRVDQLELRLAALERK
ncbi:MAG: transposase [Pseudonocardiales bacterium]|nr:transposase [Pseudonocardiales bacterium]